MLDLYEAMYIADPGLSEHEVETLAERLKAEMVQKGGEIVDLQHLGKKRLAYSIRRKRDGFYFLLYFRLARDLLSELRVGYRLNESILRFLILKKKEMPAQGLRPGEVRLPAQGLRPGAGDKTSPAESGEEEE
ncbi:MAG: 30S ribosomal protein S6 [bacterium]|nr:30S ribosomal protein S6 [bacterium]